MDTATKTMTADYFRHLGLNAQTRIVVLPMRQNPLTTIHKRNAPFVMLAMPNDLYLITLSHQPRLPWRGLSLNIKKAALNF